MAVQRVQRIIEIKGDAKGLIKTLKDIDAATKTTARNTRAIQKNTKQMASAFSRAEANIAKFSRIIKGLGLFYLAQQFYWMGRSVVDFGVSMVQANEQLYLMDVRLSRLGGGSSGAANVTRTADLARELGVSLADAADNVALLAPAFERAGVGFNATAKFAENLTKSMRVFGVDARRAQIVTVQLGQALGSGQLQGDELRSLNENAGQLGLQLERAVQEILRTTKTTKELGAEGKLTSDVMLRAFNKVFKNLERDFERLPRLLSFAANDFRNAWTNAISAVDKKFGVSDFFTGVLDAMTRRINRSTAEAAVTLEAMRALPSEVVQESYESAMVQIEAAEAALVSLQRRVATSNNQRSINALNKQISVLQERIENLRRTRAISLSVLFDTNYAEVLAQKKEIAKQVKVFVDFTMPNTFGMDAGGIKTVFSEIDAEAQQYIRDISSALTGIYGESQSTIANRLAPLLDYFDKAAKQFNISRELLITTAYKESAFKPQARSGAGAFGIMQIMPGTMQEIAGKTNIAAAKMADGVNGQFENILAGAFYLKEQLARFGGDIEKALAGYNWGPHRERLSMPGPLDKTKIPKETQDYIAKIVPALRKAEQLQGNFRGLEEDARRHQDAMDESAQREKQRQEEINRVREKAKTIEQQFLEERKRLLELFQAGDISSVEFARNLEQAAQPLLRAQQQVAEVTKRQEEAIRSGNKAWGEFMVQFEETTERTDILRRAQELLNEQLDAGVINAQQYAERMQQVVAATEGMKEQTVTLASQIGDSLEGAFGSWIDNAVEGTFRLRDVLRNLAQDIAKMAFRFALFGSNGAGGLLGGLLGGIFGAAKGAAFPQLALPQGIYTQPTFFQMPQEGPLKRYARGGVLGEAGPEAVLPLKRGADGKLGVQGGGTEVVINNYSGEDVSRRTRQLGDREIIEIAIGQMDDRIQRGGNSTARALDQAYKLRRGR